MKKSLFLIITSFVLFTVFFPSVAIGEPEKLNNLYGSVKKGVPSQLNLTIDEKYEAYALILNWETDADLDICIIDENNVSLVGCSDEALVAGPVFDYYPRKADLAYITYSGYNSNPEIIMFYTDKRFTKKGKKLKLNIVSQDNKITNYELIIGVWSLKPPDISYVFSEGDVRRTDFKFTVNTKDNSVFKGESAIYHLSLSNTGTTRINIDLSYDENIVPSSWFVTFSENPVKLNAGSKKDITLQIIPQSVNKYEVEISAKEKGGMTLYSEISIESRIKKVTGDEASPTAVADATPAVPGEASPTVAATQETTCTIGTTTYKLGQRYKECCICDASTKMVSRGNLCPSNMCGADCNCKASSTLDCTFGTVPIKENSNYGCCLCIGGDILFETSRCSINEFCNTLSCQCEEVADQDNIGEIPDDAPIDPDMMAGGPGAGSGGGITGDQDNQGGAPTTMPEGAVPPDATPEPDECTQNEGCCICISGNNVPNDALCGANYYCDTTTCNCKIS